MKNNEDWKELENWAENEKQKNIEKYGLDFEEVNTEKKRKKMIKFANIMDTTTIVGIILLVIVGLLVAFIIGFILYMQFYNLKQKYDADINSIFAMYDIKTKLVSKDVDDDGNGKYIYELNKNKNIKFTVIKHNGDLYNDYIAHCLKYYFEKWQSNSKESFIVEESLTEQGLLQYSAHIEIGSFKDIEDAANKINELVQFSGDIFHSSWDLYLSKGESRTYAPIDIESTKRYYVRYMNRTDPEQLENEKKLMTQEEIEQYFSKENLLIH